MFSQLNSCRAAVLMLLFMLSASFLIDSRSVLGQDDSNQQADEASVTASVEEDEDKAQPPDEARGRRQAGRRGGRRPGPGRPDEPQDAVPISEGESEGTETKEGSGEAKSDRDKRLEEIERMLKQLGAEIRALRKGSDAAEKGESEKQTSVAETTRLPADWLKAFNWRPIGPANMGGRIVGLAVHGGDPYSYWAATSSGGLLKTGNNGTTFEHQFDHETTVSIGAVAVAASDPDIVWVGTGENNPRNSVSYGNGVYKSTDGGKTWTHMGLEKTYQVGGVVIHPENPDVVYVGALGRLYGSNPERGLFKTSDGGKTWAKVLYVDENTGVIDLRMHPTDPESLIVAMWGRRRDGFDSWPGRDVPVPEGYNGYDPIEKWGDRGGLFKTSDGGANWKRLTNGLPTSNYGRVGLDWYHEDPNVVFAIIDCEDIGKGPKPLTAYLGAVGENEDGKARLQQVIPESPAAKAGLEVGDLLLKVDDTGIDDFDKLLDKIRDMRPGQKITLEIKRGDDVKSVEIALDVRPGQRQSASTVWLGANGEVRSGKTVLTLVVPNGPAAKSGLKSGDIVTEAEDKPVESFDGLIALVRQKRAGEKLKVKVSRDEKPEEVVVTIEDRPGARRAPSNVFMGIQGEDADEGARLTAITQGGPSEKAGLKAGDVVKQINDQKITDYRGLVGEIRRRKPGDKMKVKVRRGTEEKEIEVTLAARTGGSSTRPYGFSYGGQSPNIQDQQGAKGHLYGGIYKSTDGGESWKRINSLNSRPMYFSQIRVDPSDDKYLYVLGVSQYRSSDGGQTFQGNLGRGVHADGHALWIDPRDGRHMVIGTDGGVYVTYDRGATWDHLNHMAIGQFYHVAISPQEPYYVTGGLQDNGTWFGPSLGKHGSGPVNEDWLSVGGGDGFMCRVDPDDPNLVYYTSQNGAMRRRNMRTGESASIRPRPGEGEKPYRFNWNSPFILSSRNSRIFYCAGNFVFRSYNRGSDLKKISPELTFTKRGSSTALSQSQRNPDVLYVGTDDGALWVTRDGGQEWKEISGKVGLPGPRWVSTIEASRFAEGRVYVAFDGHRSDDDDPLVYVSEDFGETWKSIVSNLPRGSTRCLREDLESQELLFLGTEFGGWFSLDRGASWNKFNANLPTVAVHELALHPDNGEIVAATHGRSLWICDISVLRQIRSENLTDRIALYEPEPVVRWQRQPTRGRTNRRFVGSNPSTGAQIFYSLPGKAEKVSLKVFDIQGRAIRDLQVSSEAGLHRATWDLMAMLSRSASQPRGASPATAAGGRPTPPTRTSPGRTSSQRPPGSRSRPSVAPPGAYRIVLSVDGNEYARTIQVSRDPSVPSSIAAEDYVSILDAELDGDDEEEEKEREEEVEERDRIDD